MMPSGLLDGINYDEFDPTKVTLVLNAPSKDFIYVAGNFNNWQPTSAHLMKKTLRVVNIGLNLQILPQEQTMLINTGFVITQIGLLIHPQLLKPQTHFLL